MPEDERRKYKRLRENFNIKMDFDQMRDVVPFEVGQSVDVSASGFQVKVDVKIPKKSILKIKFIKPKSFDFFESRARVAWVREDREKKGIYDIGIEFIDLSEDDLAMLDFYFQ